MVLHRVHHQILRSHHLFEPLNDEQLDELIELPMAKQLIAGHLSIRPETFSRIIRRLVDEKVITQESRRIVIIDRPRLEQFE